MGRGNIPSSLKGALMQNITIGRYKPADHLVNVDCGDQTVVVDTASIYDGWIEGVRDDGSTWIMWLDAKGSPTSFWSRREQDGGVIGDPIDLGPVVD